MTSVRRQGVPHQLSLWLLTRLARYYTPRCAMHHLPTLLTRELANTASYGLLTQINGCHETPKHSLPRALRLCYWEESNSSTFCLPIGPLCHGIIRSNFQRWPPSCRAGALTGRNFIARLFHRPPDHTLTLLRFSPSPCYSLPPHSQRPTCQLRAITLCNARDRFEMVWRKTKIGRSGSFPFPWIRSRSCGDSVWVVAAWLRLTPQNTVFWVVWPCLLPASRALNCTALDLAYCTR